MMVLGAVTHKRSHTVAAIAAGTGELLGERTVSVGRRGFGALLQWARTLDGDRVWALEDCRHVSGSLERFLIGRGERVLRIPTHLSAGARRSARQRGKSDPIDAIGVARAALREGLDTFPAAHLDGPELDLRLLVDHRERLVRHRVELNKGFQEAVEASRSRRNGPADLRRDLCDSLAWKRKRPRGGRVQTCPRSCPPGPSNPAAEPRRSGS